MTPEGERESAAAELELSEEEADYVPGFELTEARAREELEAAGGLVERIKRDLA